MFDTTPRAALAALLVAFMLLASGIFIQARTQQAGAAPASSASGTVAGTVTYADTSAPARLVHVILLKIYPSQPAAPAARPAGTRPNLLAGLTRGLNELSQKLAETGLDGKFELDGVPAGGLPVQLMRQTASGAFEEPDLQTLGGLNGAGDSTDAEGHFDLAGLPPGRYALRAELPIGQLKNLGNTFKDMMYLGPESATLAMKYNGGLSVYSGNIFSPQDLTPIAIAANQDYTGANITIPVQDLQTVKVHVQDTASGAPVTVAQVELRDASGKVVLRAGFVDAGGDCVFDNVPGGSYTAALVDGVDASSSASLSLRNLAAKPTAVHYAPASTSVQVNGGPSQAVLRVSKLPAPSAGNSTHP